MKQYRHCTFLGTLNAWATLYWTTCSKMSSIDSIFVVWTGLACGVLRIVNFDYRPTEFNVRNFIAYNTFPSGMHSRHVFTCVFAFAENEKSSAERLVCLIECLFFSHLLLWFHLWPLFISSMINDDVRLCFGYQNIYIESDTSLIEMMKVITCKCVIVDGDGLFRIPIVPFINRSLIG